ncbi:MAG: hypothetical protein WA799_00900 [Nitrosotalea sp.]
MSILDANPPLRRILKLRIRILLPEVQENQFDCSDIEKIAIEEGISLSDTKKVYDFLTYIADEKLRKKLIEILKRKNKIPAGVC